MLSETSFNHIVQLLRSFEIEPKPLDHLLAEYMRAHHSIGSRMRHFISDTLFGVIRWQRRLDGCLIMQGIKRPRAGDRALAYIMWKRPAGENLSIFEDMAKESSISTDLDAYDMVEMPKKFPGGVAAFHSFPDFLYKGLRKVFGSDRAADVAQKLNLPTSPTLRINELRTNRDAVLDLLSEESVRAEPTKISPSGIRLARRIDSGSELFRDGLVEVQDEASQLSVMIADPRPGDSVLDICAGAGGKSLGSAMMMKDRGRVIASDIDDAKLAELRRRAIVLGLTSIKTMNSDALNDRGDLEGSFDLVIVLIQKDVEKYIVLQKEILKRASRFVKEGGKLIYITCSFLRDEGENVISGKILGDDFKLCSARVR